MMRKSLLLLCCLSWLSACEQAPEIPAKSSSAAEPHSTIRNDSADETGTSRKELPESRSSAAAASPKLQDEVTPPLDLSLPPELLEQPLAELESTELESLLPPLFGEKNEPPSPLQISGRLISNEKEEDYWDSIEGAELQFEFRQ